MGRQTEAQRIEQSNEATALSSFLCMLEELPDPRRGQGRCYPLESIVMVALMAAVCGADDAQAYEYWGEANETWLRSVLDLPHGPPTQDVFLRVFAALDPKKLEAVLRAWAALLATRLGGTDKHNAIDGKALRGSADGGTGKRPVHSVSAYLSAAGLVLGAVKTEEKSNEITAIPELLALLDIRGATISIDAMGCQTAIARDIVEGGGQYLFGVKDNQPTLHQQAITTFAQVDLQPDDRWDLQDEALAAERHTQDDKGHGRVEQRTVEICRDLQWMPTVERFAGASFIAGVTRDVTNLRSGKQTHEVSYYLGSDSTADASRVQAQIRHHWQIESMHWTLDVAFREDALRHRAGNTAENLSIVRRFALNIIKQDSARKLGVANSRKRAGWSPDYLLRLMVGAAA